MTAEIMAATEASMEKALENLQGGFRQRTHGSR